MKHRHRGMNWALAVLPFVLTFGSVGNAMAADAGGTEASSLSEIAPAQSPWTFNMTTYGWLSWVTGDVTVKGRPFGVEVDPRDLIDALDWSELPIWMSYAEARNGRLSLFNDIVYAKLAGSGDFAVSRPGGVATLVGDIEADYMQLTVEAGAGYEIWSQGDPASAGRVAIDALAGARYWRQEASLSADLTLNPIPGPGLIISGNRVIARSGIVDWVDPFIGARLRHTLAPGQELMLRGDIGGFGVGSDFSWQVIATSNWRLCITDTYSIDAYLGYKALSVDYSQGSGTSEYEIDVLQHGPVLGLTMRF